MDRKAGIVGDNTFERAELERALRRLTATDSMIVSDDAERLRAGVKGMGRWLALEVLAAVGVLCEEKER